MRPLQAIKDWLAYRRLIGDGRGRSGRVRAELGLRRLVRESKVPGIAIAVRQNGKPHFMRGYGWADRDKKTKVDPKHTVFRIASVSKCITGLALGKAVEEGYIDLDASLYDYVPDFPKKAYDFTIRQLAGHTAGIRGYRGVEYGLAQVKDIREGVALFADDPLEFEPGKDYLYTSFDFVLLSLAIEEAVGMPFGDYVRERVLEPLGLGDTYADASDTNVAGQAVPYTRRACSFRRSIPVDNRYKLAAGGYLSTCSDWDRPCWTGNCYRKPRIGNFLPVR